MSRERPRVVHLITRLELGGAQQNTLYCVAHHDRRRYEVGLWAGDGGFLDPQARAIADADVRLLPWLKHPIEPWSDLRAVARLAAMLVDVDLLHTHSSKAGVLGRAAARAAGVRAVVHTVHGWSFNRVQPPLTHRSYVEIERAAARVTDRIVCVSEADREAGLALGIGEPAQYRIIRSGIDPALYLPGAGARARTRAALGFAASETVVGCIANFKPQKAPLDFVEAARQAYEREPSLRFFIAGDGELRGEVIRAVDRAGLGDVVRLLGWREDVPDLLAACDVFLLTSLFEGLPRAVLQAMAASRPVVVTDTGGTAEVVEDGVNGYLVPPADPGAAAAALVLLARSAGDRIRMGEAGRLRLGREFDLRGMVGALEQVYDELLAGGAPLLAATGSSHLGAGSPGH